mmetsp:Transcript_6040/g.8376  ORF Transcript_6040/g.8376 Transcript_6040/m.8376 type:complete len:134 (-) Transcript_6040:356-757(-)|eukprot:CAMPEP_0184487948 /NCGR_PEP_ID=MMETSP0113_2-20130426/10432_1 /TAXON_ID=91329 /ORGANISM="Norrisiella sphaerica, Strain BC52" /LENGTH=133 /DNA_ID=CAMNT_0026870389 /DNA_START=295 /DNA_END=696 /DNA_ORIENTATION=+
MNTAVRALQPSSSTTLTQTVTEKPPPRKMILKLSGEAKEELSKGADKGKKVKGIYKDPGSFEKKRQEEKQGGKRAIEWTEDTVDNEFLNKKSSKICCVYHKPRKFDESDSDVSDYEKPRPYNPNQAQPSGNER